MNGLDTKAVMNFIVKLKATDKFHHCFGVVFQS